MVGDRGVSVLNHCLYVSDRLALIFNTPDSSKHTYNASQFVISTTQVPRLMMMMMMMMMRWCAAEYKGLAIDVGRQKLYYADAAEGNGNVGELSIDGTEHRVLINDSNSGPRALVLDTDNRWPRFITEFSWQQGRRF